MEVINHAGLNNFCNMIVPLPRSQTRHPVRAQAPISHTCFFDTKLYKPLPLFAFFCAYEVAQSLHENTKWGAHTRSVLARFGDNNWEMGEDFVKTFYVKKTCVGDGGELELLTNQLLFFQKTGYLMTQL